jgi:uncharacterized cupin superfamily protein
MDRPTSDFPLVNIDSLEYFSIPVGGPASERFSAHIGDIGRRIGAQKLGCNLTVIAPGMRAFPRHSHLVNEEMFFVVSGLGEIRIGEEIRPIRAGDIVSCLAGGVESAHQIANTSDDIELRVMGISTMLSPELCEYPDSGKFALSADMAGDADGKARQFRYVSRETNSLGYWDGE